MYDLAIAQSHKTSHTRRQNAYSLRKNWINEKIRLLLSIRIGVRARIGHWYAPRTFYQFELDGFQSQWWMTQFYGKRKRFFWMISFSFADQRPFTWPANQTKLIRIFGRSIGPETEESGNENLRHSNRSISKMHAATADQIKVIGRSIFKRNIDGGCYCRLWCTASIPFVLVRLLRILSGRALPNFVTVSSIVQCEQANE